MRAVWAVVVAAAVTGTVAGQDANKEKLAAYKSKVGDRTRTIKVEALDATVTFEVGGQKQVSPVKTKTTEDFTEEVLAVADGKAAKLTRAYAKARTEGGQEEGAKSYEGEKVLIERGKDGKFDFTVNGKPVPVADAKGLDKEFNGENNLEDADMLPPGPVAVGESWKLSKKVLAKFSDDTDELKVDAAKSKATNTLSKAYTKAGKRFGVIKTVATLAVSELKFGDRAVPLEDGSTLQVESAVDACFDGTSPAGSDATTVVIKLSGELPNGSLSMTGTTKSTKSVEVLPKK